MEEFTFRVDGDLDHLRQSLVQTRQEMEQASRVGRQFGSSLTRAFTEVAVRGRKLSDVVRGMALSLSRTALSAAVNPIGKAIGSGFGNILNRALGFQKGGVLAQGTPVPFAKGGVISAPTSFPLSGGRMGLAGEAGAEAILPLARGSDGRLGVKAQGQGGVSITFNVTTPDAESFRRSESQIAAMLNRTVNRGSRNL